MAVRQTFDFDTGPHASPIPTGNDIVQVNGATFTNDFKHGSFAARIANNTQYLRIANSGTATHSGSLYFKVTNNPGTSSARVVTFTSSGNTNLLSIRVHSDGKFDIANAGNTRMVSSTVTWTANQWYRLDWQWNQVSTAAPVLNVQIFTNDEGTIANDSMSWTASGLSAPCGRWTFGFLASSAAFAGVLDTFRVADGLEWIGAFEPGGPPPPPPVGTVVHAWVGAPTADGFKVTAKTSSLTSTRLKVCTDPAMTQNEVFTTAVVPDAAGYVVHLVAGLGANTQYFYQVEDTPTGGQAVLVGVVGKARTLPPADSPQNFTFAFGGCMTNNNPENRGINDILAWNPNFMIQMGDFHYRDPNSTDPAFHRQKWEDQILSAGSGSLKTLVRDMPMFYVRSDHDAGPGDNGDSNTPSTAASIAGYKEIVPYPVLGDTRTPTVGLYFTWVVGRVRFILVDIRNQDRSPGLDPQSPSKTMLGAVQKQWLKDQLLMPEPVKVIVSDVAWSGPASLSAGTDKWWAYDHERTELANFITTNNVKCVMLVSDNHSLTADDGGLNAWGGFAIFGAAPLGNIGGGRNLDYFEHVYNTGNDTQGSQYGRVTVTDTGTAITFAYDGYDAIGQTVRISESKTFQTDGDPPPPPPTTRDFLFNTGPAGTAIATGGDVVQVSGATYTADAAHGEFAARFANNAQYLRVANSGTATHSGSLYFKPTGTQSSSSGRVVTFTTSNNTNLLSIRIHSDDKFDIANASNTRVAASTVTWTANQWYRIDWQWDQVSTAAPVLTLRIFTSPESDTPAETISWTASGLGAPCARWTLGMLSSSTSYQGNIDTFRVTDGLEWIGPYVVTLGMGKMFNASTQTWEPFTPQVQENGQMVPAVAKVYVDGRWVETS